MTYDEARSSQKYSGRRNALGPSALPASPRIFHLKFVDRLAFGTADAVVPSPRIRVGVLPLFFGEQLVDLSLIHI